jgi:hypothetical protein
MMEVVRLCAALLVIATREATTDMSANTNTITGEEVMGGGGLSEWRGAAPPSQWAV